MNEAFGGGCINFLLSTASSFFLPSPNSLLFPTLLNARFLSSPSSADMQSSPLGVRSKSSSLCKRGTDELRGLLVEGEAVESALVGWPLIAKCSLYLIDSERAQTSRTIYGK